MLELCISQQNINIGKNVTVFVLSFSVGFIPQLDLKKNRPWTSLDFQLTRNREWRKVTSKLHCPTYILTFHFIPSVLWPWSNLAHRSHPEILGEKLQVLQKNIHTEVSLFRTVTFYWISKYLPFLRDTVLKPWLPSQRSFTTSVPVVHSSLIKAFWLWSFCSFFQVIL